MLLRRNTPVPIRLAFAFGLFTAGCTPGAASTGIPELSCPPDSTLTYANFGQDVITTRCMSCHDEQSPQLETQAQVKTRAGQILDLAVYTSAMPLDAEMPLDERRMLGEWLVCGAP
jgi:uncharacterized membrane protein